MSLSDVVVARISENDLTLGELVQSVELREAFEKAIDLAVVRHCVRQAADAHQLEVGEDEVEARLTSFREARKLYKADDMMQWLEANHFTIEELEEELHYEGLLEAWKAELRKRVEGYFHEHRLDFETVLLGHLLVAEEGLGRELLTQIDEEEAEFEALAKRYHQAQVETLASPPGTHKAFWGGLIGTVHRRDTQGEMGTRVFSVKEGTVLGPFHIKEGWDLVKLLHTEGATLDDKTRAVIEQALFSEWLDQARSELPVERLYRT